MVQALVHQRYHGKYKDDLDGFINELKIVKQSSGTGEPAAVSGGDIFTARGQSILNNESYNEILKDMQLFEEEIQIQLMQKINDKKNSELKKSDLIKPKRSENLMYRRQVDSLEDSIRILERDNDQLAGK